MTCLGISTWGRRFVVSLRRGWRDRGMGAMRCLLVRQRSSQPNEQQTYCSKACIIEQIACVGHLDIDIQSVPVDLAAWPQIEHLRLAKIWSGF